MRTHQLNGFGRKISSTGKFHIGWFKSDEPYGYGIGNYYTGDNEVKEGLYSKTGKREYVVIPDSEINHAKRAKFA